MAFNMALAEAATAASIHNFAHGEIKNGLSNVAAAIAAVASTVATALSTAGPAGKLLSKIPDRISIIANNVSIGLANLDSQKLADAIVDLGIFYGESMARSDYEMPNSLQGDILDDYDKMKDDIKKRKEERRKLEEHKNKEQMDELEDFVQNAIDSINKVSVDMIINTQNEIKKQINNLLNEVPSFLKNPSTWLKFGWWPEKYAGSYKAIVDVVESQVKRLKVVK